MSLNNNAYHFDEDAYNDLRRYLRRARAGLKNDPDANEIHGEQFLIFAKLEPFLKDIRTAFGAQFLLNLEKFIDATPGGRERSSMVRERMKGIRARLAAAQTTAGR